MNTEDSNLRAIIAPIMADVSAVMTKWFDPNGPFDQMAVKIGVEEISSQDETPQVYWVPLEDGGYEVNLGDHPDAGVAEYYTWTLCQVKVWGDNLDEAVRLRDAVLVKARLRWSGAAVKASGKGKYSKGLSTSERGVSITFGLAFKIPILSELWPEVTITEANVVPLPDVPYQPAIPGVPGRPAIPAQTGQTPPASGQPGAYGVYVSNQLSVNPEAMEP